MACGHDRVLPPHCTVQTWANFGAGNAQGLGVLGALPARGWVDLTSSGDGDRVTLTQNGVTVIYEMDNNASCTSAPPGLICAPYTASSGPSALQLAINNTVLSPVGASSVTNTPARVNLFTKVAGELTGANTVTLTVSGGLARSEATLVEGHDADLWVANNGDNSIRRFLTSGTPPVAAHGTFNVGAPQFGLAVRDVWTTTTERLFDAVEYFVDDGNNNQLLATRTTVTGGGGVITTATLPFFTLTNGGGFNALWDVQLLPNGCLVVSDDGNGDVFAIDTTNPANTTPFVERIARNLPRPRGLALDSAGNLLIAVDQGNAVLRLSPTPSTTDCFCAHVHPAIACSTPRWPAPASPRVPPVPAGLPCASAPVVARHRRLDDGSRTVPLTTQAPEDPYPRDDC